MFVCGVGHLRCSHVQVTSLFQVTIVASTFRIASHKKTSRRRSDSRPALRPRHIR